MDAITDVAGETLDNADRVIELRCRTPRATRAGRDIVAMAMMKELRKKLDRNNTKSSTLCCCVVADHNIIISLKGRHRCLAISRHESR